MKIGSIEENVPLPSKSRETIYAKNLEIMKVQDSFMITFEKDDHTCVVRNRLHAALPKYGKKHNMKFITRTIKDENNKEIGIRVWRFQ